MHFKTVRLVAIHNGLKRTISINGGLRLLQYLLAVGLDCYMSIDGGLICCCFSRLFGLLIPGHVQAGKMGSSALAFSLPFSCIFGLLASMAAATIGRSILVFRVLLRRTFFNVCSRSSIHTNTLESSYQYGSSTYGFTPWSSSLS